MTLGRTIYPSLRGAQIEGPIDYEGRREVAKNVVELLRADLSQFFPSIEALSVETDEWMGNPDCRYELRAERGATGLVNSFKRFIRGDGLLLATAPVSITGRQKLVLGYGELITRPHVERIVGEHYPFLDLGTHWPLMRI